MFKKYFKEIIDIDLINSQITEMDWELCPPNLQKIRLDYNNITTMNWKNCPPNLQIIYLSGNKITTMNWTNCPPNLLIYPLDLHEQFQEYKKTLPFYKEMSKKVRPIVDEVLHFHMQPPNKNASANALQQHGGILFHEDMENIKELI